MSETVFSDEPLSVGILGATGVVGQRVVTRLSGHPWFRVGALAGSIRSQGRAYRDAVRWLEPTPIPGWAASMTVRPPDPGLGCDLVISALDSDAAAAVEPRFLDAGVPVISNAKTFRMEAGVPLLVPDVNPDHAEVLRNRPRGRGFVVTNPNCSTTGLVVALKPLADTFGIGRLSVTTLQAVSGAGHPGVPSMDILGNVLPDIEGEAEKLETETQKILGDRVGPDIRRASFPVGAQANRVPVLDGHLLSVAVETLRPARVHEAREFFEECRSPLRDLGLPSAPEEPIRFSPDRGFPQPRLHAMSGNGMAVCVGGLKACPALGLRFLVLVHNTVRGAAGGALLNAEFLLAKGLLTGVS